MGKRENFERKTVNGRRIREGSSSYLTDKTPPVSEISAPNQFHFTKKSEQRKAYPEEPWPKSRRAALVEGGGDRESFSKSSALST